MKVENSKAMQKSFIILGIGGMVFLLSLTYLLSLDNLERSFELFTYITIPLLVLLGFLIYFLIRKITRTYYLFDEKGFRKIRRNEEVFALEWNQITDMYYIRLRWILLLQFGSGYLIVEYLSGTTKKQHEIALSCKQVKQISKKFNKQIEIK